MESDDLGRSGTDSKRPAVGPVYNERGVIAETYHDLQGLSTLHASRDAFPLPKASTKSALRAVFQCAEIALVNLTDLTERAAADVERQAYGAAVVKMVWARGFHRVLSRVSMIPQQIARVIPEGDGVSLGIRESPSFAAFFAALTGFDARVGGHIDSGLLNAEVAVAEYSLDRPEFSLLHLARTCNLDSTIWETNLAQVSVPGPAVPYEEFVSAALIREAVFERTLTGDTYFTQFRGLHQIPEILGEEVNDRLDAAIAGIRADALQDALEHLECVEVFCDVIGAATPVMADSLATSDYHVIRENLGLTSGSHSVCLRFHMFSHLYEDLSRELQHCASRDGTAGQADEVLRAVSSRRFIDMRAFLIHLIGGYCLRFRAFVQQWRNEHLSLPRNNLGGDKTKSLAGSSDGLRTVKSMRDTARTSDPLAPLVRARGIAGPSGKGQLETYYDSAESLDARLLSLTGSITQHRFVQVQERLGFFANGCPFSPPPRRNG